MFSEENVIKEDINKILIEYGFSPDEFKITIEKGTRYDPSQIVGVQIWITIERNTLKKKYGLYRSGWPYDFETDLRNGYFNN
jgi:hypothetical protein